MTIAANRCPDAGKRRMSSRAEAKRIARVKHPGHSMNVWQCEHCSFWHIGHRRKPFLAEVVAQELLTNGGHVSREHLAVLAAATVRPGDRNRKGLVSTQALADLLRLLARDGIVHRTDTTVELVDPIKLAQFVDDAKAKLRRSQSAGAA